MRMIQGFLPTIMAALPLVFGPTQAAEQEGSSTPAVLAPTTEASAPAESPEQARRRALVDAHGAEIADAILTGTVLKAMTMEQVMLARGAPARIEVIPPDSALWHYPDGEVAFADGKTSYVDLRDLPVRDDPAGQSHARRTPIPSKDREAVEPPSRRDTASVNTPGDGFLALRSEPSIRCGKRLLKIPHNTVLTLDECVTSEADGRWCRTGFQGEVGWVSPGLVGSGMAGARWRPPLDWAVLSHSNLLQSVP